jgi:hypothetical protein
MTDQDQAAAAARGFITAIGAFLIAAFAFSSDAPKTPEKSNKDAVTYTISPAILNEEEKRRKASNPSKSSQKKNAGKLFNRVSRTLGKAVNKSQGRPYPQTHIKRGASNNLRQTF